MADVVKRLNYFDHQFLRAPDFNDEQSYNLRMRRLHNQTLHTPGIVQGLVPSAQAGATVVTVSAGVAIDSQGREIVLAADTQLDLTNEASGNTVYFTIQYNEQQSDPSADAGATGNTRWTESPTVTFSEQQPPASSTALVLGQVTRTATGLSAIDLSARTSAGVVVSGDLKVNSVSLKRDGVDPSAWPKLSSTGANQATLSVSNLSLDANREVFFADNGQLRSFDDTHKIFFNRANNRMEISEFGDIVFNTGGANPPERLRIASSGNVGIGTQPTRGRLQVSGGAVGTTIGLFGDVGISLVANWPSIGWNCYFNNSWKSISPGYAGVMDVSQNDGYMDFYLAGAKAAAADADVSPTVRMRLSPDGQLAIGATTPAGTLHIQKDAGGAVGPILTLMNGAGGAGAGVALNFYTYGLNGDPSSSIRAIDEGFFSNGIAFLTKAPGAPANTLQERLRITRDGKLSSSMWRVTHVMDQRQGPLPVSAGFSSGGGTLVIIFSGSGWSGGAGNIGLALQLDGGTITTTRSFTNEASSHKAFTTNMKVQSNVGAGNHTITLVALANTNSDGNDWFNVTVLEMPF